MKPADQYSDDPLGWGEPPVHFSLGASTWGWWTASEGWLTSPRRKSPI